MRKHVGMAGGLLAAALHAAACAPARSAPPERTQRSDRAGGALTSSPAPVTSPPVEAAAPAPAAASTDSSPITCASGARGVNCAQAVSVPGDDAASLARPVSSVTLTDEDLRAIGSSSGDWVAFAQRSAGTSVGDAAVYVDGMPARGNLPSSEIARISVNADPFSAEFGGVNQLRIDIDSRAPDRRWRFQSGLPSLEAGGGSPLAASGPPAIRRLSGGLSGPVARTPLTFSIHSTRRSDRREPLFADATSGRLTAAGDDLRLSTRSIGVTAGVVLSTARVLARLNGSSARMRSENAGVGGINAASTGQSLAMSDEHARAAWRVTGATLVHRGGATLSRSRLDGTAQATGPSIVITGQAARGSNELTVSRHDYFSWDVKHAVHAPGGRRPWKAGFDATHTSVGERREWNPFGRLQLASPASRTGTWTISQGAADVRAEAASAALFGEQTLWQSRAGMIRAGGRLEWQNGDGVLLSPRLAAGTRLAGFQVSGGAGLFVQPWVPDTFAAAGLRSAGGVRVLVVPDAALDAIGAIDPAAGERLRTELAPSYTRRRDVIVRAGVERRRGPLRLGVERAWTFGSALAGAVRLRDAGGLVDRVDSARRLRRVRTHAHTGLVWRGQSLAARYEHLASMDDTDGTFTFPARQDDIGAEWAPSAALPRHTVTLTAGFRLPSAVRVTVTGDARSGSRYNIMSGADEEGLGAFTGRSGRPRNSGVLPATRNLSVYVARPLRLKVLPKITLDLGARIDNVTNRRNVNAVGRVAGSALFGQPLNAAAGRSVRIWAAVR